MPRTLPHWRSTRTPTTTQSWQLLAASRFLEGDAAGALEAWNRRGEPRVDLPHIDGLSRTRYDVVAGALALPARTMLTRDRLDRAARRVAGVPAVQLSRVDYSPRENGSATVNVAVVERPLLPLSPAELAATAMYAATQREAQINVSSPSGNGELWTVSARWWAGRPRAQVALAVPKLAHWTGVWRIAGGWERQTYRHATDEYRERPAICVCELWGLGIEPRPLASRRGDRSVERRRDPAVDSRRSRTAGCREITSPSPWRRAPRRDLVQPRCPRAGGRRST